MVWCCEIWLRQIHDYVAHDSKIYAKRLTNQIVSKSEYLKSFPYMGKIVEEVNDPRIRETPVFSYRMIFEIDGEDVLI